MGAQHPLKLAVIGAGRIADRHLAAVRALPEQVICVAVVDINEDAARKAASQFDVPFWATSMDQLAKMADIDAVIVCTPNALHEPQATEAMARGWHVLLEKPFAETELGGQRLVEASQASGLVLVAGHTYRHVPAVRYLIDNRANFGRLRALSVQMCVHWDGPQAPWWAERKPQEGLLLSLYAPHALDFVYLATGGMLPETLDVQSARHQSSWSAEDEAMIQMRYADGTLASVHVSYNQPYMINRKTLHFERALVEIEYGDRLSINGEVVVPSVNDGELHRLGGRNGDHYFISQLEQFFLAIRGQPNYSVHAREASEIAELNRRIIAMSAQNWRG